MLGIRDIQYTGTDLNAKPTWVETFYPGGDNSQPSKDAKISWPFSTRIRIGRVRNEPGGRKYWRHLNLRHGPRWGNEKANLRPAVTWSHMDQRTVRQPRPTARQEPAVNLSGIKHPVRQIALFPVRYSLQACYNLTITCHLPRFNLRIPANLHRELRIAKKKYTRCSSRI